MNHNRPDTCMPPPDDAAAAVIDFIRSRIEARGEIAAEVS